jgi:RND family efflux transporter MFP subunit
VNPAPPVTQAGSISPSSDLASLRIDDTRRLRTPWLRWSAWFTCAAVLTTAAWMLLFTARGEATVQTAVVRTAVVDLSGDLLNASGYVTPRRRATVAAKITGRVQQIAVDEGQRVATGQLLAMLDDADLRARLGLAKAERDAIAKSLDDLHVTLAAARREMQRATDLYRKGLATGQSVDGFQADVDSLQARIGTVEEQIKAADGRVAVALQDLENCSIRAPFSGLVVSKDAQVGEMVSPNSVGGFTRTGIVTLVDMSSLEVEVDVNESFIARIAPQQRLRATLNAYPDWHIPGHVRTIIPTADRQKATVKVRAAFDELDPRILPDMGLKVAFLSNEGESVSAPPVILVPQRAVRTEGDSAFAFVVRDDQVTRRRIRVGAASGEDRQILEGLVPGEQVVVASTEALIDGQRVTLGR